MVTWLPVGIIQRFRQAQPVMLACHHCERRVRGRGVEGSIQIEDHGNDVTAGDGNGDFAPDPFGSEGAGPSDHDDLAALEHLAARLAAEVVAGDIFGLVEKHAEAGLLQPLLEPARQSHSVRMIVGEEEIVAEHPVDEPRHQTFGLHWLGGNRHRTRNQKSCIGQKNTRSRRG